MPLGESEQKRMELAPLALVERGEELVFEALREAPEAIECRSPRWCDLDDLPAPVGGISAPLDQPGLVELVEQADQLAPVVAEGVGDRALRLARPLVEDGQDRMVIRVQTRLLVRGEGLLLRRHPQPLEQEQRRGDQLLRKALR